MKYLEMAAILSSSLALKSNVLDVDGVLAGARFVL